MPTEADADCKQRSDGLEAAFQFYESQKLNLHAILLNK
jgi:hypothetical protein